ncbi:RhuM family protein [Vulcanococcus limneticus]|uniref:RhuM family protein n=1 Tax=Vulcanococcus limneticus TaxID=2170428 RepID=UPI00398BE095
MSSTPERWGEREVGRHKEFFNLDTILSVGYRVNSKRGTQFHLWVIRMLREHQGCWHLDVIGRYTKTFLLLRPNEVRPAVVRLKVSSGDIVSAPLPGRRGAARAPRQWPHRME